MQVHAQNDTGKDYEAWARSITTNSYALSSKSTATITDNYRDASLTEVCKPLTI